jgi:hypothetical protein
MHANATGRTRTLNVIYHHLQYADLALVLGGKLYAEVGEAIPLAEARRAHEMLAGFPHRPGKIVLVPAAGIGPC